MQDSVIEGTAQEIMGRLAEVPPGERVRVVIGRPSLSTIARRLQETAASIGMTDEIHDELLKSLKHEG